MSHEPPQHPLLILSPDPELFRWLLTDLDAVACGEDVYEASLSGHCFRMWGVFEKSSLPERSPDLVLGLVRYVDVVSLSALGELLKEEAARALRPTSILVYRKDEESDFKMSCPFCGQKLWVRDADVDKRGRCPNCHKGFTLPAQADHVSNFLHLAKNILVETAVQGNPSSLISPLKHLLRVRADEVALQVAGDSLFRTSGETMNVNIETGPIPPHVR